MRQHITLSKLWINTETFHEIGSSPGTLDGKRRCISQETWRYCGHKQDQYGEGIIFYRSACWSTVQYSKCALVVQYLLVYWSYIRLHRKYSMGTVMDQLLQPLFRTYSYMCTNNHQAYLSAWRIFEMILYSIINYKDKKNKVCTAHKTFWTQCHISTGSRLVLPSWPSFF